MFIASDNNTTSYLCQYGIVFDLKNTDSYSGAMSTLRENLQREMDLRGWNAYDLFDKSGVPQPTIQRFLTGKHGDPRSETVRKLARGLNISEAELRGFTAQGRTATDIEKNNNLNTLEGNIDANNKIQIQGQVPLISWVQAGGYNEAIDLYEPGYGEDLVNVTVQVGRHTFALRVVGDSMEPEFFEGEMIVVEPDMQFENGDFVIAKAGNDATFKKVTKVDGDWYLKPLNGTYPTKPLGEGHIIGVVRYKVKRYR
jgi:SOS-response transcriptional repressor LexA